MEARLLYFPLVNQWYGRTPLLQIWSLAACYWQDTYLDDIDKLDGHNEPAVVDYMEYIYKYYKAALVTTIFLFSMSVEATHNCTFSLKMKYEHIANIT